MTASPAYPLNESGNFIYNKWFLENNNDTYGEFGKANTYEYEDSWYDDGPCSKPYIDPDTLRYSTAIMFAMIFVIGLIGNITVMFIVVRHRSMKTAPNLYVANLALGDIILLIVTVPMAASAYIADTFPFEPLETWISVCKIIYFVKAWSIGMSTFTLVALSVDRMLAIACIAARNRLRRTKSSASAPRIFTTIVIIWILSVVFAVPNAVSYSVEVEESDSYQNDTYKRAYCLAYSDSADWFGGHYPQIHIISQFTIFYAVPLSVIAICYIISAVSMIQSTKQMPGQAGSMTKAVKKQMEARMRVAKTVIALVILFAVCWLPRYIYLIWYNFALGEYCNSWIVFQTFGYCASFANSCVNPIALYFLSRKFRRLYNRYLFRSTQSVVSVDTTNYTAESTNTICSSPDGEGNPIVFFPSNRSLKSMSSANGGLSISRTSAV